MKTHFAEENADVISEKDTADEHCWREHRISKPQLIGDMVIVVVLLVGLSLTGWLHGSASVAPSDNRMTAQLPMPAFANHIMRERFADVDGDR